MSKDPENVYGDPVDEHQNFTMKLGLGRTIYGVNIDVNPQASHTLLGSFDTLDQ